MYMISRPSYCYQPRRVRNLDLMSIFDEPVLKRPRRCHTMEIWKPIDFEDLIPRRSVFRSNPFHDLNQILNSANQKCQNWNQPLMKITKPENLKIKIDQENNKISIKYQDDNSMYHSTKSLPKYISDHKMHQEIKCQIVDGQIKMIWPKKPDTPAVETKKPEMIEVTPEIINLKSGSDEEKISGSESQNIETATQNTSEKNDDEDLEVEVVNK